MKTQTIIELLQSKKLKERNEALGNIESCLPGLFSSDIKEVILVSKALLSLIHFEFLNKEKTTTAKARITRASSLLRNTIEQATRKLSPRPSSYISILNSLISQINDLVFPDFMKSIKVICEQQYIKDHFNSQTWELCIKFFMSLMGSSVDDLNAFSESIDGFNTLINSNNICYLPVNEIDLEKLLEIFMHVFYKGDKSNILIYTNILRITNKLLMQCSSEKYKSLNGFVKLGLKVLNYVKFKSQNQYIINDEISIFLNLEYVHYSIIRLMKEDPRRLDDIRSFITFQLNEMDTTNVLLHHDHIGISLNDDPQHWFKLQTIYLKNQDYSIWLFLMGLTKLIVSYFESNQDKHNTEDNLTRVTKKKKFDGILHALITSDNVIEFFLSLISLDQADKFKSFALQLLIFSLELDISEIDQQFLEENIRKVTPNGTETEYKDEGDPEDHFNWSFSILSNNSMDIQSQSLTSNIEENNVIKLLLAASTYKFLSFWSLLLLNSLIVKVTKSSIFISAKQTNEIIKILLPNIKTDQNGEVACHLLYNIVRMIIVKGIDLSQAPDKALLNQVQNILELASYSGPFALSNSSFKFWLSLFKLMRFLGLNLHDFQSSLSDWMLSKWNQVFDVQSNSFCRNFPIFTDYVYWMIENKVKDVYVPDTNIYNGHLKTLHFIQPNVSRFRELFKPELTHSLEIDFTENFNMDFSFNRVVEKFFRLRNEIEEGFPEYSTKMYYFKIMAFDLDLFPDEKRDLFNLPNPDITHEQMIEVVAAIYELNRPELLIKLFDTNQLFRPIKRFNDKTDIDFDTSSEKHSATIPTIDEIIYCGSIERDTGIHVFEIDIVVYILSRFEEFNSPYSYFSSWLSSLSAPELVYMLSRLSYCDNIDVSPTNVVGEALKVFGKTALQDLGLERNEVVLINLIRLTTILTDHHANNTLTLDFLNWIITAANKKLLLTKSVCIEYLRMILHIKQIATIDVKYPELWKSFLSYFKWIDTDLRIKLIDNINDYFVSLDSSSKKVSFYRDLVDCFSAPDSAEEGVTYCLFLASLIPTNLDITKSIIFNLLEIAWLQEENIITVNDSLDLICKNLGAPNRQYLFRSTKISIFKAWISHHSLTSFPHRAVDNKYQSQQEFYDDNIIEFLSVMISSTKSTGKKKELHKLFEYRNGIKLMELLPLSYPLAYVSDGVQSELPIVLLDFIKADFSKCLKSHTNLIVLGIIRLLDTTKFHRMSKYVKLQNVDFKALDSVLDLVPLKTGMSLINSLIPSSNFWSRELGHFYATRLLVDLKYQLMNTQKILCIRRIVFVVLMISEPLHFETISSIVRNTLCLASLDSSLAKEIYNLFTLLDFNKYNKELEGRKFDELSLMVLSVIVQSICLSSTSPLENLQSYSEVIQIFQELPNAYTEHFNYLKKLSISKENTIRQSFSVDQFIECKVNDSYKYGLQVCSFIASYATLTGTENKKFIEAFISNPIDLFSMQFKYLCGRTIARDYFENRLSNSNSTSNDYEFNDIQPCNYLEEAIKLLFKFKSYEDIEITGLADLTLGLLGVDATMLGHIDDSKRSSILEFSEVSIIRTFKPPAYIHRTDVSDEFVSWLKDKFLLVINELNSLRHKSLHVIKEFGRYSFDYIIYAFPYVICYFLNYCSGKGPTIAFDIFNRFFKDQTLQSQILCETILKSLLLIRLESKSNKSNFKSLYLSLNIDNICEVAVKYNYARTGLMLFEDHHFNSMHHIQRSDCVPKWYQKDYIINIFDSIDCDDLINGLPRFTTLETTLHSIWNNNEVYSNERTKFELGLFESGMLFKSPRDCHPLIEGLLDDGLSATGKLIGDYHNVISDVNFEWAWKLNSWNLPVPEKPTSEHEVIYKALKLIRNEKPLYDQTVLSYGSNTSDIEKKLKLLFVNWIDQKDQLLNSQHKRTFKSKRDVFHSTLLALDNIYQLYKCGEAESGRLSCLSELPYDKIDNIISSSVMALNVMNLNEIIKRQAVLQGLAVYNNISIRTGRDQNSIKSILLMNDICQMEGTPNNLTNFAQYHIAKGLWHLNHHNSALSMMLQVKKVLSDRKTTGFYNFDFNDINIFMVDSLLADWLSTSRRELPRAIIDNYFHNVSELQNNCSPRLIGKTFAKLGKFCEDQYRNGPINAQLTKINIQIIKKKKELEQLKDHYSKQAVPSQEKKLVQKYYTSLKQQVSSETIDQQRLIESRNLFIMKCTECYLSSIFNFNDFEIVDKFFSLWFEESNLEILNELIEAKFSEIMLNYPSLFVGWISQLISRLADEPDTDLFQNLIQRLIISICIKYPYHSMYHLLSLKEHMNQVGSTLDNEMMFSKIRAANRVFEKVKSSRLSSYSLEPIACQMTQFCNESINLSKFQLQKSKKLDLRTTSKLNGKFWLSLPSMPCPTQNLAIADIDTIKDLPRLESIDPIVTVASSGLSLPKICKFRLTNGEEIKVLFKSGVDDLRQDAIMEQVFDKVNQILNKNKSSERRNLRIRTYKIVPLGPNSGVLEFVANSMALIDIIKPYHDKLDKIDHSKAREIMRSCQNDSRQERIRVFKNQVISRVNPVLHQFFFDNYLSPKEWFQNRVTYSRGLAITSMIGHILGLGDRHCNNILLDKNTAEPIHIDLGVAFDQGTKLQIPETVPFRLTRDLVDGLGVSGVDGIFRGSCEVSFSILRQSKDHIVSILNVFRWDPLYKWTISPLRRKKLQLTDHNALYNDEEHDISEGGRAILTVKDKLKANGLSPEAVVQELITTATDLENLALIFSGWSPFY